MLRKKLFFLTFLLLLLGGGQLWADKTIKTVNFTDTGVFSLQNEIANATEIGTCLFYGESASIDGDGLKFTSNMKISSHYVAIPLNGNDIYNGTVTVTVTGASRPRYSYAITSNSATITSKEDVARPSSGSSVTFTITDIPKSTTTYLCLGQTGSINETGNPFKTVTVTTPDAGSTEYLYSIPIEDLRFEHMIYNPSRSGVLGLDITTSGWQSNTKTDTTPYEYTLMLTSSALSSNSITVTTSGNIIKKVVLVGADGAGTFANCTVTGDNNHPTTDQDQIQWVNDGGANTATISFTTTDRPSVSAIYVVTNTPLSETKQSVKLSFDPDFGFADTGITDQQIDGKVKASIDSGSAENFRPDDFTSASVTNFGSNASYNQFHISTGKVGVNTGSAAGEATITATFSGNQFYNAATSSGSYRLTINSSGTTKTKTITINDMRISKTASSSGLNASSYKLDRTLGGFAFTYSGNEGVKFNNGDFIILRNQGEGNVGSITITPQVNSDKTVTINKVVINTVAGSTTGSVTATKGTGTSGTIDLNGSSTHTFEDVEASSFNLTAVSGDVYIQSYTIYYTESADGALNDAVITPTITFSKVSDTVNSGGTYTSPTITTTPAYFDISLSSSNTGVATVKTSNWMTSPLVSLTNNAGTATITASATNSTFFNAATDATYTVTYVVDAAAQKWDFRTLNVANTITDDKGWNDERGWSKSGDYYQNLFTTSNNSDVSTYAPTSPSQLEGLKFGRVNSSGLGTGQIRLYSSYMQFRNTAIWVDVPVTAAGDKVIVTFDGGNGTTQAGFSITNATVEGDATATSILSDETQTTVTLIATAAGFVRLQVTKKSNVKLYRIQVSTETRATLNLRDTSNSYEKNVGTGTTASTNNHFSHRVMFTPSDGATEPVTYADDASRFHITSSDPSVLDVSNTYVVESSFGKSSSFYFANVIPVGAGTATLTITFDGNDNYKPNSYVSQTYTVYGSGSFLVSANDQEIQQGQLSTIIPIITDKNGNPIGIKEMTDGSGRYTTYILGEDEDVPDYTDFFDFSYTAGTGSGTDYDIITVDGIGRISTGDNGVEAAVGTTRMITVSATPKGAYSSAFSSTEAVAEELIVTIIEKTADVQVEFYWDAACSAKITMADPSASVTGDDNTYADKVWTFNSGKFSDGFPNGRILYVKPKNEGDAIWFSYAQDANAAVIPANPTLDRKNRVYQYRRGIPIYIDDDLSGSNYVNVNVVATTYDASTKKYTLRGTVARLMFPKIVTHDRPAEPTYDPISPDATASLNKDGRKIMNTSENVVAYGEGASKTTTGVGNLVYGKFSTGTVYTTEQLINENAVQLGTNSVPVVSTEVAKRRFTAVQVKHYNDSGTYGEADYISEQTYTEYWYLFDTDLRLYSDAEKTTPLQRLDIATGATTASPYYRVTWYNKRNYDDPGNYSLGVTQEVDSYDSKISYTIMSRSGASEATIDASTGVVTAGSKPGWVRVKATYAGGEEHGGKSGEPQYKSTTDESEAYFYVYIADPATHKPIITPQTCNFAGTMTYKVQAPQEWKVRYTVDGSDPSFTNGTEINAEVTVENTIGSGMSVGDHVTVKAIAYNSDGTLTSAIVSETYTKKDAIPDPIFDPNGVGTAYRYNTSTLTVQIACARAGANIYYTVDDTDPVIGNANTYKYSGLSKVVISGNVAIKAIAYDPVEDMYSNVVTSNYVYSNVMDKPYFQISDDGGATWYGYNTEGSDTWVLNGTKWYNGQSHDVTPSTLIRIIDPNPVKGTIFYTVDDTTPADNATSMVYAEGYPFTVAKSSTGKAITILEDANSQESSAVFNMKSGHNVWEAVDETMTYLNGKHGIFKSTSKTVNESTINKTKTKDSGESLTTADGFVISTNKDLYVTNTESNVNLYSIDTGNGGTATKMYAQAYITATFGGCVPKDDNDESKVKSLDWTEMTIADAAIGTPIDGVGTYSIKNDDNAQMEIKSTDRPKKDTYNYNHVNSLLTDVHDRTFKIPSRGSYVRFEPEKDGDLTIWVLQQGAVHYEEDEYFIDRYIRMKPVYMVDEQGKSYQVKTINGVPQLWSSARLSTNWTRLQEVAAENGGAGGWANYDRNDGNKLVGDYIYLNYLTGEVTTSEPSDFENNSGTKKSDNKKYKRMENKGPNRAESQTLYNLYKAYLDKNHVSVGDPIKPFAIHTGTAISQNNGNYSDNSNDGTGYVLVSGGYAKYTFEVKAGKSYYFFATGSKVGVRGFQFVPTETTKTENRTSVTINPNPDSGKSEYSVDGVAKTLAETKTACADKPVNVTLNRTFKKDTWTSLVLPFSVSTTQLEKVFGDGKVGPEVLHFLDVTQSGVHWRLRLMQHYHQMLVAGTPVLIKAAKDVKDPVFEGVQIEADAVTPMTVDDYTMKGTFVQQTGTTDEEKVDWLKSGDYFMANSGKFMRWTGVDTAMRGTYAWLHPNTPEAAARVLDFSFEDYEGVTTGIIEVEIPAGSTTFDGIKDGAVYDLNGRKVSQSRFTNLPKGVYIVNGKKMIVD